MSTVEFTPKEESAILSCIANRIAICCDRNAGLRRTLVSTVGKQRALATFAHENLACSAPTSVASGDDSELITSWWEYQLDRVASWLDDRRPL